MCLKDKVLPAVNQSLSSSVFSVSSSILVLRLRYSKIELLGLKSGLSADCVLHMGGESI